MNRRRRVTVPVSQLAKIFPEVVVALGKTSPESVGVAGATEMEKKEQVGVLNEGLTALLVEGLKGVSFLMNRTENRMNTARVSLEAQLRRMETNVTTITASMETARDHGSAELAGVAGMPVDAMATAAVQMEAAMAVAMGQVAEALVTAAAGAAAAAVSAEGAMAAAAVAGGEGGRWDVDPLAGAGAGPRGV